MQQNYKNDNFNHDYYLDRLLDAIIDDAAINIAESPFSRQRIEQVLEKCLVFRLKRFGHHQAPECIKLPCGLH